MPGVLATITRSYNRTVRIVCFDTSGINQLLNDPQNETLRSRLVLNRRPRVTALNVIEIARTKSPARREALRRLEFELSSGELPFEIPNDLLLRYTRALIAGAGEMEVTLEGDGRALWSALARADAVTEELQAELLRWTRELDESRRLAGVALGTAVDEKLPRAVDRVSGPIPLLRQFMMRENWLKVYWFPARVVKEETGKVLPASKLDALLTAAPGFWAVYLSAIVVQMYADAFWHREHGRRPKPSLLDMWAGMYLPLCDDFVTNDFDQFTALRIMNVFSGRRPRARVLTWPQFRKDLLAG